ncbi:MAG: LptA/OstA family protein [Limisphaerales bacterium]
MNLRAACLAALVLAVPSARAQNNLFSTSTTAPTAKTNGTPQQIEVLADGQGTFSLKEEYALYRNNVRVNDPQFFLRCESLRLNLDLKSGKGTTQPAGKLPTPLPPKGTNATAAGPWIGPMGGRVRDAEAHGGVVFSNKVDFSQAFADHMVYRSTNDAFELTGNARVIKGTITNTATTIFFYRADGRFEAVGNVRTEGSYASTKTNSPASTPAPKSP